MGIKANELRIGNLVYFDDGIYNVWSLTKDIAALDSKILDRHRGGVNLEHIQPIPLTEEWFPRFGLKINHLNMGAYNVELNDFFTLQFEPKDQWNKEDGFHLLVNGVEYDSGVFIKYVHQFQNLCHCLTIDLKPV